jgi:hypothetical protein
MTESRQFLLGAIDADYIRITILGRTAPKATDFWDGNWLNAIVDLHVGGFQGNLKGDLRADELQKFRADLPELHRTLRGTVALVTLESWLEIKCVGDGRGHVDCACRICDQDGWTGNILAFHIHLDQTYLPAILRSLDEVLAVYPVYG